MSIVKASIESSNVLAGIIKQSNIPVAKQFNITKENNSKHPSFYTTEWAKSDFERGEEYFIYLEGDIALGCVAFERASENVGYLNRLSVLPEHQRKGVGAELVKHVLKHAKSQNIATVSIGIIAEYEDLKNWYKSLGFKENGTKLFPYLPFNVMFMTYSL